MSAPADRSAAQPSAKVVIEPPISLGQFVKLAGLAATGGEAKHLVLSGLVLLNGQVEHRRGRKVKPGDLVEVQGQMVQATGPPCQSRGGSRCSSAG